MLFCRLLKQKVEPYSAISQFCNLKICKISGMSAWLIISTTKI